MNLSFLAALATTRRARLLALPLAFLLSSCSDSRLLSYGEDTNFLIFDHPYTEKAAAEVRAQAEKLCAVRAQSVVLTGSTCSLSKCTTTYQCQETGTAVGQAR